MPKVNSPHGLPDLSAAALARWSVLQLDTPMIMSTGLLGIERGDEKGGGATAKKLRKSDRVSMEVF